MAEADRTSPLARPSIWIGLGGFILLLLLPAPPGMSAAAWTVAALALLMAYWWMSEAVPLTVTAFLPFLVVPFTGAMDANKIAAAYYSPILFLILGGALLALAIEKAGLHRRLALAIVGRARSTPGGLLFAFIVATALLSMFISNTSTALIMMPMALALLAAGGTDPEEQGGFPAALVLGIAFAATIGGLGTLVGSPTNAIVGRARSTPGGLLFAFIVATALLSMFISNTSTALIMMPMALALLAAGGTDPEEQGGFPAALVLGIAFAATIGGLGTLVGSPTNAIAAGLIEAATGESISFLRWASYGVPVVLLSLPVLAIILMTVLGVRASGFDVAGARAEMMRHVAGPWNSAERRLVPILLLVVALWIGQRWLEPLLPKDSLTDGTIAMAGALLLFLVPAGRGGRGDGAENGPLLTWKEANQAPWAIVMMFGGGLALAAAMGASGLADWLGAALAPLGALPLPVIVLLVVALMIGFTEFASNVATASGILPVVAALAMGMGVDPMLLLMPAALAASWGYILPAGTGPNAIAYATGRARIGDFARTGVALDVAGLLILTAPVWLVHYLLS